MLESDYVFHPRVFTELQHAQAIALPYDGLNPLPAQYCYLKPHYLDVQNVDLLAQSSMKAQLNQFRKVEPDGTDADFAMLDGILQQAGLSSARRTKINSMFYARPGG